MYWKYLKQLLRHKWFVFVEGLNIGCPIYLLIIHDWSKFLPSEFIPYANYFGGNYKYPDYPKDIQRNFDVAWLYHQKRNKHHWQYWVLIQDDDPRLCIEMPQKYLLEMIADWRGAGRAYGKTTRGDNPNTKQWYLDHKDKILLNNNTQYDLEVFLDWDGSIEL